MILIMALAVTVIINIIINIYITIIITIIIIVIIIMKKCSQHDGFCRGQAMSHSLRLRVLSLGCLLFRVMLPFVRVLLLL